MDIFTGANHNKCIKHNIALIVINIHITSISFSLTKKITFTKLCISPHSFTLNKFLLHAKMSKEKSRNRTNKIY